MRRKVYLFLIVLLVFVNFVSFPIVRAESDNNASSFTRGYYTYDYWGNVMASAPPYQMQRELSYLDLGLPNNSQFADVVYFNDMIYIVDVGLNAIYVIDYNFNLLQIIDKFDNNGVMDSFNAPKSVFVDNNQCIYIADSGNSRIVKLNPDYSLALIISKPDHLTLEELTFVPLDIAVSYTGRIFVIGENIYYGIMELDEYGQFSRFIGTNRVKVSFVELFYRSLMSVEQRDYASLILPQEFRSIDTDDKGFVYATSFTQEAPIKRINTNGEDVLYKNWFFEPVGDVDKNIPSSELIAISANDHGIYMALDRMAGRIFVYNHDGEILYILGGLERQDNYFIQPVDLEWMKDDDICVVDTKKSSIIIFSPTEFGKAVNKAVRYHYDGLYEEALEYWQQARKYNSNYDLAYVGIGKAYLYTEEYKLAMDNFKLGNNRSYYSDAYAKYSREIMKDNFGYFILAISLVTVAAFIPKIIRKIKYREGGAKDNE